ncbi:lysylphosphatidylglycerol synthase transmembrane domain-containing protein [Microcoleus sp. FACHB-672]|uniref:lysylphosphatidylglycerol synthase transmembrane domain-containing protein n=1 Tax=Microcoleus sp. FACHB-672 TaxID=2692825 RepID=UPI0016863380|nr:lysylphosphatidylglycerol synthase transmembrane domain-containing protein [Microcoleus sp. FACHB-672]MBD2041735.1 flippase-like domain-containing protein [Microcoleus sp. FACHB-672]
MKRIISLAVSLIILAVIYSKIDFLNLIKVFQNCHVIWIAISLGMVVPLTMLTSWRLQQLMPTGSRLGFGEANGLILAASTLNMVLPSKMGDIAKAYFMRDKGHLSGSLSLSLVVFEKACDMLSLLLWCVFGLMFYRHKDILFWLMTAGVATGLLAGILLLSSRRLAQLFFTILSGFAPKKLKVKLDKMRFSWSEMHDYFWSDKRQLAIITGTSIFIWFCHLLQIWFFILALNAWTPFLANLALSPLAILAGLLPLTFAGVGTRDAALILFYQPYFNAPTAAALGLLCTSRYVIPALAGLPFLGQYLTAVRGKV